MDIVDELKAIQECPRCKAAEALQAQEQIDKRKANKVALILFLIALVFLGLSMWG